MKTTLEELAELSKAIEDKMIALGFKDEVDKILQDPANEGRVYLTMFEFLCNHFLHNVLTSKE